MSSFLQWPANTKPIFFVIAISIISPVAYAFEFGVSPSELNFEGKTNEEICKKINILSSINKINISVFDKWSIDEKQIRKINSYYIDKERLEINLEYDKNFILNKNKETTVCLKSYNEGNFKGILIFEALNKSLLIGVWINANIENKKETSKITGFSISEFGENNSVKLFLPITFFNLFLFLALLVAYLKKKKRLYN